MSKETYYSVKRDLLQCQKRPTTNVSKETYYSVKETGSRRAKDQHHPPPYDDGPTLDTRSWPDKRQNTRVSGDTAQQHRMTLGTACGIPYPKTKQKPIDFFLINSGMEPTQRINLVYAWNNSPNLANNQNTTQLLHPPESCPDLHRDLRRGRHSSP